MNKHCECKLAGFCNRHKMQKSKRKHELCSGVAGTRDCGLKYWNAWEQGRNGATKPDVPNISPIAFCEKEVASSKLRIRRSPGPAYIECGHVGKLVADEPCNCGTKVKIPVYECLHQITKNKRCVKTNHDLHRLKDKTLQKVMTSCESCVFKEADNKHLKPNPFTQKPRITLLCHCWPNGDNWQKHIGYLKKTDGLYARRIMAVATGPGTASFEEVTKAFGPGWEYLDLKNDPEIHEVHTARIMFNEVATTDPNDVTVYMHLKGVKNHTSNCKSVKWWIEAMYETVIYNTADVIKRMEDGSSIVGSFRRHGKHFKTTYDWHYSGTFYAMRNSSTFANSVPAFDSKFWGTESWPGKHFPLDQSACIFGDFAGHLYDVKQELKDALIEWREHNENRT